MDFLVAKLSISEEDVAGIIVGIGYHMVILSADHKAVMLAIDIHRQSELIVAAIEFSARPSADNPGSVIHIG